MLARLEIPRSSAIPSPALRSIRCAGVLATSLVLQFSSILAAQVPSPPSPPRFMVVLDAAHGGDDSGGKLSGGQLEKAFNLALSVRLRSLLAARGIQVVTTRESDATVAPVRRAEFANRAIAQACLSLHASESGTGVHLFVSSLSPAQPSRFVPWRTAQASWITRSLALAGDLNSALLHANFSVTLGRTSLPTVDSMACPAVAVEVAPEAQQSPVPGQPSTAGLDDPAYQARVAEALAAALLEWRSDASRTDSGRSEDRNP